MVPTADNNTPTPAPTGNLEQLFRQQLGEAEVAPRMHLWEQIDHELLVQQNETYRRRLVWHRWVAAACILLFLGAGSWFVVQRPGLTGASDNVAGLAANSAGSLASTAAGQAATKAGAPGVSAGSATSAVAAASSASSDAGQNALVHQAASATGAADNASTATGRYTVTAAPYSGTARPTGRAIAARSAGASAADASINSFFGRSRAQDGRTSSSLAYGSRPAGSAGSLFDMTMTARNGSYVRPAATAATWLTTLNSRTRALASLLSIDHPDTLKAMLSTVPTLALAQASPAHTQDDPAPQPTARARRWRLMGSYGASAYNPNMAFGAAPVVASKSGITPNGFTSARTSNTYEQAAAEYRQNLRPGFAQRVALTVSYAATKHWTIGSGMQAAEQQATSQTSYAFLDGKLPAAEPMGTADRSNANNSLTPPRPATLHTAQYRYRTAGVPVSVRYGSTKNGVSLYAKVGAAVNVLFSTQSELVGAPDSRTAYSLGSAGSPYRKVQGSASAGAGVRYKPTAAQWSLSVGPTAEAGLSTLNADAAHSSYQTRPYAIGLEASVEFGGRTAPILH